MTERAVVFKTPGKLDMRALTIFGMNAKPTTSTPIGFFGTGLKYAMAVLAREGLKVTIIPDSSTTWTITTKKTDFRGKGFETIQLTRNRMILGPTSRDLPYTTEHGKNWELWQAFRELYSNTLDENGETFIYDPVAYSFEESKNPKGYTYIVVEGEKFVQEYLDREKTFLPDGLRARPESGHRVQVFDRPSDCIYYRGIRVLNLHPEQKSQLTYNILSKIDLTEDRTAKYDFQLFSEIEGYAQETENEDHITKIVAPPAKSMERRLTWDYGHYKPPSKQFIDTTMKVKEEGKLDVSSAAISRVRSYLPPEPKVEDYWLNKMIQLLSVDESYESTDADHIEVGKLVWREPARLLKILKATTAEEFPF